jgi:hypothetical protein
MHNSIQIPLVLLSTDTGWVSLSLVIKGPNAKGMVMEMTTGSYKKVQCDDYNIACVGVFPRNSSYLHDHLTTEHQAHSMASHVSANILIFNLYIPI